MKKLWTLLIAGILSSSFALATPATSFEQNPEAKKPKAEEMVDKTMEESGKKLPLSAAKNKQLKSILLDFHTQIPETMKKGEKAMDALEEKTNKKVKALLSDKEYSIYQETMKTLKPSGPPRGLKMK